jgi:hypothetical protein
MRPGHRTPAEVLVIDMEIWLVGILILFDGQELGWMAEGVFLTEDEAAEAARPEEFIVCVKVGERLPVDVKDAIKFYWPKKEKWEESALFKLREAPHHA